MKLEEFARYLKPRPRDWHKGNCGHVLVVGGDMGYSGAVRLAAEAALRVGAGLVSIATHARHADFLNFSRPEIMSHSSDDLIYLLKKADVLVVGPGLGKTDWSDELFRTMMRSDKPMIVDADALNILAAAPRKKSHWILTPHPGEAARLLQMTVEKIQHDRVSAVKKLQHQFGGVAVLKGAGTLVASGEGEPDICHAGNPGMATAGMGDVLSGVIGGLLAQGVPLIDAAKLGVLVHATAGDLAAKAGERGMISSDLMPYLRELVNAA